jgi:hypothetical protein
MWWLWDLKTKEWNVCLSSCKIVIFHEEGLIAYGEVVLQSQVATVGFVLDKGALLGGGGGVSPEYPRCPVSHFGCIAQSSSTVCDYVWFAYQRAHCHISGLVTFHPALRCVHNAEFNEVHIGVVNETYDGMYNLQNLCEPSRLEGRPLHFWSENDITLTSVGLV